jgi:serine protease AprX
MRTIIALFAILVTPIICSGGSPKLARDLDKFEPGSTVDVIVQFATPPRKTQHEQVKKRGGHLKTEFGVLPAALYSISATTVGDLADDPDVVYISPDREVRATLDYGNPTVGAPLAAEYGWDGTGVGVAVIDSGILPPRDLQDTSSNQSNVSRIVYSKSFVPKVSNSTDQYGHGTHVAGIIAGNGYASTGSPYFKTFRGVAPRAKLINLRVLDSQGSGKDSTVISAIDEAIRLKNTYNIRVINLSLGRPVFESYKKDPLCQAVERAWKAGIVVVVSAGNEGRNQSRGTDGYASITSPGNDPLVITVGAMKHMNTSYPSDDLIASYSSKGPTLIDHVVKPDLVAPGNRLISLVASKSIISSNFSVNKIPYSYYQTTSSKSYSGDYYRLSGTSMAAPMVSGTVAAMLQRDWSLTNETVKARLMLTASKAFPMYSTAVDPVTSVQYASQYDIYTVGAGYLDTWAALNCLDIVPPGSTTASPTAVFDAATNTVRVVNTDTALWGKAAVWGTAELFGTAAVWGTTVFVDGHAAVWGTSALWGSAAVWGTAGVAGNAAIWGSGAIWGTGSNALTGSMSRLINGEN